MHLWKNNLRNKNKNSFRFYKDYEKKKKGN